MEEVMETAEDIRALKEIEQATADLIALTTHWTEHEDVPGSQEGKCKEIGRRLHELGGMHAMQEAYREAKATNRAASVVQAFWHGIGDWQW